MTECAFGQADPPIDVDVPTTVEIQTDDDNDGGGDDDGHDDDDDDAGIDDHRVYHNADDGAIEADDDNDDCVMVAPEASRVEPCMDLSAGYIMLVDIFTADPFVPDFSAEYDMLVAMFDD